MTSFTDTGTGMFIEELLPLCLACPIGTYQDKQRQSTCTKCPETFSTLRNGATSMSYCKGISVAIILFLWKSYVLFTEKCQPNTYSSTGFVPCVSCPPGQFQPHYGKLSCITCDVKGCNIDNGGPNESESL